MSGASTPHDVSKKPDPERGSEEYVVSLERRIAEQRNELRVLHERLRDGHGGKLRANRQARKRIAKLERLVGKQALRLENQHYGLLALNGEIEVAPRTGHRIEPAVSPRWPNVGEVFRSRDRRDHGLTVTVIETDYDGGRVRVQRHNRVWVKIVNFRRLYIGPVANTGSRHGDAA